MGDSEITKNERNFEIHSNCSFVNKDIRSDASKIRNKTIASEFELVKGFNSSIFIT